MKKDLFIFPFPCFKRVSRKNYSSLHRTNTRLCMVWKAGLSIALFLSRGFHGFYPWHCYNWIIYILWPMKHFVGLSFAIYFQVFFPDNVLTGLVTSYNQRNILLAFLLLSNSRFFPRQCSNGIIYIKQPMKKFVLMTYPSSPANTDICVINDRLYSTPLS